MPYEFPLLWLHLDAPFHPFYDRHVPHQYPNKPEDQVVPQPEPLEEHVPEPILEWDIDAVFMVSSEIQSSLAEFGAKMRRFGAPPWALNAKMALSASNTHKTESLCPLLGAKRPTGV
ncbi:hypothetical protein AHAS_Ahas11G0227200 [Arachis hypogaea]